MERIAAWRDDAVEARICCEHADTDSVPVNVRPSYYDGKTGMQPFDVIDEFGLDFYEGNCVKYLVRWRKKNGLEDLRKARAYLNRIIDRAEQAGPAEPF